MTAKARPSAKPNHKRSLPSYEIQHTREAPALDGWLDSPPWRGARWVERFLAMDTAAAAPKETKAALLWDDHTLYLGVTCEEPRLALLRADTRPGEPAGSEDCIEFRLNADLPGVEYLTIWLNGAGTVAVSAHIIDNPGWGTGHPRPATGIKSAARFTATGWQVEVAIPFASLRLPAPRAGTCWHGVVGRTDGLAYQWYAWAPDAATAFTYDDVRVFPSLLFSKADAAKATLPVKPRAAAWPKGSRFPLRGFMYDTSRGSMIYTPAWWKERLPLFQSLGYNAVLLYFENHLRYASRPEFAPPGSWTVPELVSVQEHYAAGGIDLIPAQTTFGHCPGILNHPAYKHLAEAGSDGYQFCPAHPETYEVLGDILSELATASRSPYLSINADESAYLGLCPRCQKAFKGQSKGEIFHRHIRRLHDIVSSCGKRMMMWDDMLWTYPESVKGLPRDIIMLDWHYSLHRRYPSVPAWRAQGFDVVACPGMAQVENAFWLADQGAEDGAFGLINTLWEDHNLPIGNRWHHFLATDWAARAKAPADINAWFKQAAVRCFGEAGVRLGHSLAAQNLAGRNLYAQGKGGNAALAHRAEHQVLEEARRLLAGGGLSGWPLILLSEFVYARRLVLLQRESASGLTTPAARQAAERELRALTREGTALWNRSCTCPSQQPAFFARHTAIEKALHHN